MGHARDRGPRDRISSVKVARAWSEGRFVPSSCSRRFAAVHTAPSHRHRPPTIVIGWDGALRFVTLGSQGNRTGPQGSRPGYPHWCLVLTYCINSTRALRPAEIFGARKGRLWRCHRNRTRRSITLHTQKARASYTRGASSLFHSCDQVVPGRAPTERPACHKKILKQSVLICRHIGHAFESAMISDAHLVHTHI